MLHRRTYDTLSDEGTVLLWEKGVHGGIIVVKESPSTYAVWHESWDESLEQIKRYDLHDISDATKEHDFTESQEIAKGLMKLVVWA